MAPETANQKRKRGRPGNASRDGNNEDASKTQLTLTNKGQLSEPSGTLEEPTVDEDPRPKKRGRPGRAEVPPEPEPESSTQPQGKGNKRKRGQQPSEPQDDTGGKQGGPEHANIEDPQPKKRGRGARNTQASKESEQTAEAVVEPETTKPKKAGRPRKDASANVEQEVREEDAPASDSKQPRKSGRPRKAPQVAKETEVGAEEADDENEGDSSLLRRSGRTRRLERDKNVQHETKGSQEPDPDSGQSKKRGPKRKLREPSPKDVAEEEQPAAEPKKRRGRPSREDDAPAESPAPETVPKKLGRRITAADKPGPSTESRQPRRKPSSHNQEAPAQEPPRRQKPDESKDTPAKPKGPRRSPRGANRQSPHSSASDSDSSSPPYRHLTTRTRRVPLHTIDAKWTPLDASSISSVTNLLHSASRPVLTRLTNLQRHKHATAVLNTVSNKLRSKLARGLPFPPATTSARRGDELEFERTVAGIRALESQLDPLLHSVELLRREKARAERELARDYRILGQLGTNARAEAREKRDRVRKMHGLVPPPLPDRGKGKGAGADVLGLLPADRTAGRVFADLAGGNKGKEKEKEKEREEELRGLAAQIGNHMESMRGNLQQIDGVVPEIARSRALLRAALQKHLDRDVLEGVVLG
ncbi:CENP-Q, a CENPA-CAD centromere complex subunit-domain-containing protein [Biscogniauxia mediterranea]|nr:CENP-Q, a CENPA-CAD centromere complex subunit-domain-containing protein [Biscogniauxia mediterranea]